MQGFLLLSEFHVFVPVVSNRVLISALFSSSAEGIKNCAITVGIKTYKSIIKKKKKKHDKLVLLVKTKLNAVEVLISKALIGSCINYSFQ